MFKTLFIKLFIITCIWMMNATSSFGQRIGIIDVVTRQETANTYLLTVRTFSEHEIKLSLIKSDGTLFLERFVGPKGILQYRLPVGTYQVIAAGCQPEVYMSHCIQLGY